MNYKDAFLEIFDRCITREGAEKLRSYLLSSDFFTAPASSRFHCAYEGGLCEHSVNTYQRLLTNVKNEYGDKWQDYYSEETIAICGLLHDLCKMQFLFLCIFLFGIYLWNGSSLFSIALRSQVTNK